MTKALELAELAQALTVDANGNIDFNEDLDVSTLTTTSATVNGNITVTGTVDGVDVGTFKSDYDTHTHTLSQITDFNAGDYAAATHTHIKANITDFSDSDYDAAGSAVALSIALG